MKYIDTHCHVFPDKMAKKALEVLTGNCDYRPTTDGTLADTIEKQSDWGCKQFVMLDIATSAQAVPKVNDFLMAHNDNRRIFAFGTLHPTFRDFKAELARLEAAKIKGIKFHPGYQNFLMDDKAMYPLYEDIAKRNMIMLFHGGYDPAFTGTNYSDPDRAGNVVRDFRGAKIIMAHLGNVLNNRMAMEHLLGEDIYFDISMTNFHMPKAQIEQLIKAHGADKFLYATDAPWSEGPSVQKLVNSLNLTDKDKEKIFYRNAVKLLDIKEGDVE